MLRKVNSDVIRRLLLEPEGLTTQHLSAVEKLLLLLKQSRLSALFLRSDPASRRQDQRMMEPLAVL